MNVLPRLPITISQHCEYTGHTGSVFAAALDEAERFLYTSGDDGIVARWDLHRLPDDGEAVLRIATSVYAMLLVPAHDLLVAGASDGTIHFVDLAERKIVHSHRKTTDAVYGFYWDAARSRVWVLQAKGLLSAIRLPDFSEDFILKMSGENLRAILRAPSGEGVYVGASDKSITLIDPAGPKRLHQWEAHEHSVFSLAVHPEGKYLLSGGRDAHLNAWDLLDAHALIKSIPAHNFTINDIAFSPDGDYFMTASRDKTLKLWDAWTFELLKVIDHGRHEGHKHSVNKLKWLKSDNSVISVGDDRRIIRWNVEIGT